MVSLLHRATIKKLQGKNIMAPLLHRAAIIITMTTTKMMMTTTMMIRGMTTKATPK